MTRFRSHPMWVRGLKLAVRHIACLRVVSHPMWVRGLKLESMRTSNEILGSHPMWVRGLKHVENEVQTNAQSRTPCGCVD